MGDTQSAQREARDRAAADEEEETGEVKDAETEPYTDDKVVRKNVQMAEISGKADSSAAALNGPCEEELAVEAVFSADIDTSERSEQNKTPRENDDIILKELPDEDVANKTDEIMEMDAKQNDINESFRRFFSNISLKLTVKRGSASQDSSVQDAPEEEPNKPEGFTDNLKEIITKKAQQNANHKAQEAHDNESTTCKTLTDAAVLEFVEKTKKNAEPKQEISSHDAATGITLPILQNDSPEEEPLHTTPAGPDGNEITTQFKRIFTTGIFSSFRKRKSLVEDKVSDKELLEEEITGAAEPAQDQHDEKEVSPTVTTEKEKHKEENQTAESIQATNEAESTSVVETDIINSQEKDKVLASPLKRFKSSSSFKRLSKKQRSRKSSDAKLSTSDEHSSDQLLSSTESAVHQKEETSAQPSAKTAGREDGAWASFKKLMTPQKHTKRPSLDQEVGQIPGLVEGAKPGEEEQTSDQSTEEGKKCKDSSVSWEAVLCGSGRRRSRKTSDSDDETHQKDNGVKKQDSEPKETPVESSSEAQQVLTSSLNQTGSPSEGDERSAWKSFKKLVTPKRKVKDEDECISEVIQDDSSFSLKRLLPGRKDKKSVERQNVSSDETDGRAASGDEDSETPAVVPLSEFDTAETPIQIHIQAVIQSYTSEEERNKELQKNLPDEKTEAVLPCDSLPTGAESPFLKKEEPDELTETSSKHQQLSDISEEGVVTETTPDDLIEITSEAITAPELVDVTAADETEMISAVSQQIESEKTSGNATPVPAEYIIMNTESLLQQVSETISVGPAIVTVCSEEPSSERVLCSISHQLFSNLLETDQPKVLEIYRRSDATALKTGLKSEEIDAVRELAVTAQTENVSYLNEALPTETVSEVLIEKFATAKAVVDEVHQVNVSQVRGSVKESERSDESQPVSAMSRENLQEEEKVFFKTDFQKDEMMVTPGDETETMKKNSEEAMVKDQPAAVVVGLETGAETDVLASEEGDVQSCEVQDSGNTPSPETAENETKQTECLTEQTEKPQKKESEKTNINDTTELIETVQEPVLELEKDIVQFLNTDEKDPDEHKQTKCVDEETHEPGTEPQTDEAGDVLEVVPVPILQPEDLFQSLNKDVAFSENIAPDETESKHVEYLLEKCNEQENTELQRDHAELPEELEVEQEPAFKLEEDTVQSLNTEEKYAPDELKQTTFLSKKTNEPEKETQTDENQLDCTKDTEAKVLQEPTFESYKVQSLNKEKAFSDHTVPDESDTDEEQQAEITTEQQNTEPQTAEYQLDQTEAMQKVELLQDSTVESEVCVVQSITNRLTSENTAEAEINISETKNREFLNDESENTNLQTKTDHTEVTEALEGLQEATFKSQKNPVHSFNQEVLFSEKTAAAEGGTNEPNQNDIGDEQEKKKAQEDEDGGSEVSESTDVTQVLQIFQVKDMYELTEVSEVEQESKDKEKFQLSEVKEGSELEDILEVKEICKVTEVSETKEVSEVSAVPEKSENEEVSDNKEGFELAKVSEVKDVSEVSEANNLSEVKEIAKVPEISEVAKLLDVKAVSEVKEISELDEVSEVKDMFKVKKVSEVVQETSSESETNRDQFLEKEVISEDELPPAVTGEEESKEEPECPTEVEAEVEDAPETENVQEVKVAVDPACDLEAGSHESAKELKSDVQAVTEEPKQTTENGTKSEEETFVELKVPTQEDKDITETETNVEISPPAAEQHVEENITLLKDVPHPKQTESVTEETERKAELHEASKIHKDQEPESLFCDEENLSETVEKIQVLTDGHISSVMKEQERAQILKETHCADEAEVSDKASHKVNLCQLQESLEVGEAGELPGPEAKVAATDHTVLTHEGLHQHEDVLPEKPQVSVQGPLMDRLLDEAVFNDATSAALIRDNIHETAEEDSVMVMMVPSGEAEVNHKVQLQVIEAEIRSAQNTIDALLEVRLTEAREVIAVCHETTERVEKLSATLVIEEDSINEEVQVMIQEVIQHLERKFPEAEAGSVVETVERVLKQADVGTEGREMEPNESNKAEDQLIKNSTQSDMERPDEEDICDNSAVTAEPQGPEDQTARVLDSLDLEETKTLLERSEVCRTEDVRAEKLTELRENTTETKRLQTAQSHIITQRSIGPENPQNTELSSSDNLESPSGVSLEFKLNIQFGPVPAFPPADRAEPERSDVQALQQQREAIQQSESQTQTQVAAQATEKTEPADKLHSTQRAIITTQPLLQTVHVQRLESEPAKQIKCTGTLEVQVAEERQEDTSAELLREPLLSETKTQEALKQPEEENDQEEWLDAEEDIYTQRSSDEIEEAVELLTDAEQSKQPEHELEVKTCDPRTRENQQDAQNPPGTLENESEGEDFAVALEDLEISSSAVEWD